MDDTEPTTAPAVREIDARRAVASMEAILECVAQPVWVVDHEGLVAFVNPAGLAALGYDELSELQGRRGHETIHYKHRDGSPYPAEDCPMTRIRGTGETIHMEEDWFVRRDGTMFPVSYTGTPLALPGGPGVVVAFKDIEEQRAAEQALREREAILAKVGQPVWVTDQAGFFHYANPAALAALGYDEVSEVVGHRAHELVHYKYPDGTPFPEDDCPLVQARAVGEDAAGHRRLARAQGRLDRARHLLVGALRAARRPRLGDRLHRRRGAAPRRAGGARARRGRGAGSRAAGRAPAHHRGGRCRAGATRARSPRRRAAAVRQRGAPAPARRAQGGIGPGRGARAARAGDRAGRRRPHGAAPPCLRDPPRDPHRPRPRAGGRNRSPPGCRSPSPSSRRPTFGSGPGRGQRLLLRLRGADQRGQARAGA